MEDKMHPLRLLCPNAVKDSANGVRNPTQKEQKSPWHKTNCSRQRNEGADDQPTHQNIIDHADDLETFQINEIQGEAD